MGNVERASPRSALARKTLIALLVGSAAVVGAHAATASPQFKATFRLAYLSPQPGASTGLTTVMTWRDPGAQAGVPKVIKRIDLRFPGGARLDTSALPTCTASDARVKAIGAAACPAPSRLGSGSTIGLLASGAQILTQVTVFNARHQIIVLVTVNGATVTEFRDDVTRSEIVVNPVLPSGVSLARLALRIDPHTSATGAKRKAYLRTPPTCPASGRWTIVGIFTYADASSQRLTSHSPCAGRRRGPARRHG